VSEPEIGIIEPAEVAPAEVTPEDWRAERQRHQGEARRRYLERLVRALEELGEPGDQIAVARVALDALCSWVDIESGEPCLCSCHPRLPSGDLHDYGFGCRCQKTRDENLACWTDWRMQNEAFWASAEGQSLTAARQAEEEALAGWLRGHPLVTVSSHGGMCPEQWEGEVDGHSFYFRERHDQWRLELDLRPVGRFYKVLVAADGEDEAGYEQREVTEGEVIAEGTVAAPGYGASPIERIAFIVDTVRSHILRQDCRIHSVGRDDLERRLGHLAGWCPACGARLTEALVP
jgi:hypothetical protein